VRVTKARDRLDQQRLVDEAIATAGHDDFGEPTWREGLSNLLESLIEEARLHELGVEIAAGNVLDYLVNRLHITAYRTEHPEIATVGITQPIVIVGQPRTGTTILYDLLAQDPALRAPLSWEVALPSPPPETATYDTDPRIREVQAQLDMADVLIPGFSDFHPMGAQLAQECVCMTAGDFRSMIFPTQYRVPSYSRWLQREADLAPAYAYHRVFLQHLQSRHPAPRWLLKSPAHLWHLDAFAGEYPDAIVVQTHRDPLKVIASVSALVAHLRRMASDDTSTAEAAEEWADDIFLGLDRGMDARNRGVLPAGQVIDVHFRTFVEDPLSTIAAVYVAIGRELTPDAERRMRAFLEHHPGDGGGGGTRYRFADTGLDAVSLRERAAVYQACYGVESEPVT
jgi:hypothetical protein